MTELLVLDHWLGEQTGQTDAKFDPEIVDRLALQLRDSYHADGQPSVVVETATSVEIAGDNKTLDSAVDAQVPHSANLSNLQVTLSESLPKPAWRLPSRRRRLATCC